jgi:hypothetical protein
LTKAHRAGSQLSRGQRLAINIAMNRPKHLLTFALLLGIIGLPAAGLAGPHKGITGPLQPTVPVVVSGKLLTNQGQPAANRRIHFENRVNGDVFLTRTGADGSFSFALPTGTYDLREEHGPIVVSYIAALGDDVNLGTVSEPPGIQHLLQGEAVAPALIRSPAPITSNPVPGKPIGHQQIPVPPAAP